MLLDQATDAGPFAEWILLDCEITRPLPDITGPAGTSALVLVRLHTEPIGQVRVVLDDDGVPADRLSDEIWASLSDVIGERVGTPVVSLTADGLALDDTQSDYLATRAAVLQNAPAISVVICSRDRSEGLERSLVALKEQKYNHFEVVVVDNAPSDTSTADLVADFEANYPLRYVLEPTAGLSRARNTGAREASSDVVAFIDDDELPDTHWLAEIARGFAVGDEVGAVSGMILPAAVATPAQAWFEELGGHSKGRGFDQEIFTKDGDQSALYPLPAFGAGGNMAFRRSALNDIGGFDTALGAGTPARGGEDTLALSLVLLANYSVVYRPSAFVRHHHYADFAGMARQREGYGTGLTAYYAALLRHNPALVAQLVRLAPSALHDLLGKNQTSETTAPDGLPLELRQRHLRATLRGPGAYWRGRRSDRRHRAATSSRP
jgi:glycosyltransferase involved in cell wall biosynthesis